jgi:ring-1,2-phenylacetyl-CoA epoxidase subunit PaaD
MATAQSQAYKAAVAALRALLDEVHDPEIPILTIADLGVLRDVRIEAGQPVVVITPTYSGCPAMHAIEDDIRQVLTAAGHREVRVETQLAPAWSTDDMSLAAHAKLRSVGIAPPTSVITDKRALLGEHVMCPRCAARNTERVSEFGSTACKALYRCLSCLEPFDYFKCL